MRVIQERNENNTPQVTYTRGLDLAGSWERAGGIGGLLARTAHSGANGVTYTPAFYHADGNGNVTYLLKLDQTAGATYTFDPYGRLLASSGTLAAANTYRFSSKELMLSSGLYYYGYRFYDPNTQRWLNRDPIQESGGINLYGFVGNSPSQRVDPFGYSGVNPGGTVGMCTQEYWEIAKWLAEEAFEEATGLPAPSLKGMAKKASREAVSKARSALKLTKGTARNNLRDSLGLPSGVGRAHHNIPLEHRDHPLVRKAAEGGFNFNKGLDNGTALKEEFHYGRPKWHEQYNKAVGEDLDALNNKNLSPEEAAALMRQYSDKMRELFSQAGKCIK